MAHRSRFLKTAKTVTETCGHPISLSQEAELELGISGTTAAS